MKIKTRRPPKEPLQKQNKKPQSTLTHVWLSDRKRLMRQGRKKAQNLTVIMSVVSHVSFLLFRFWFSRFLLQQRINDLFPLACRPKRRVIFKKHAVHKIERSSVHTPWNEKNHHKDWVNSEAEDRIIATIHTGKRTEWSPIRSVIIRVITNPIC